MKEIIVKNYKDREGQNYSGTNNYFKVKPIIKDTDKCSANFVEVDPGCHAYSYHYHEENEEIFYIISGKARVKAVDKEIDLEEGDVICFPRGKAGAHVIYNLSKTEKLIYLDVGSANKPDIIHFRENGAGMVITKEKVYNFKDSEDI